jgi:putative tricarboxylic transport membrane protein
MTAPEETPAAAPDEIPAAGPHEAPAAGPVANLVTAGCLVALGVAALAASFGLGVGSAAAPGSGTWPMLVSLTLSVLAVVLAAFARRTRDAERFGRPCLIVAAVVAGMAVFTALLGTVGFEIPSFVLLLAWMRFLGRESWRLSLIVSAAIVAAFYALFVGALNVSLPHLF